MMYTLVLILTPFAIGLPLLALAGRAFAKRRRREGEWDQDGPVHPTDVPIAFLEPRSTISDLQDLRDDLEKR
jgi:hypothetical protein